MKWANSQTNTTSQNNLQKKKKERNSKQPYKQIILVIKIFRTKISDIEDFAGEFYQISEEII